LCTSKKPLHRLHFPIRRISLEDFIEQLVVEVEVGREMEVVDHLTYTPPRKIRDRSVRYKQCRLVALG
jgi:hypothetical protein